MGARAGCPTLSGTTDTESASHFGARLRDALSAHGLFGKLGATFRLNSGMYFPVERSKEAAPHFERSFWDALSAVDRCHSFKSVPNDPKCRMTRRIAKAPQPERTAGLMKRG